MSLKRQPSDSEGCSVNKKSRYSELPKLRVSNAEELDLNTLRFQNKKLIERLEVRQKSEYDLKHRIEQLVKKLTSTEAIVYVINRYWNQLNEDVRVLLQRFDFETSDEKEKSNEFEATTSFVSQLSNLDKDDLDEDLRNRVYISTRQVGKVLQAFDRIVQRNEKITLALKGESDDSDDIPSLDEAVKNANVELQNENKNLNTLVTTLHEKTHLSTLKCAEMEDKVVSLEQANDECKLRIDDLEYELNRTRTRENRLEEHLNEAREKLKELQEMELEVKVKQEDPEANAEGSQSSSNGQVKQASVSQSKLDEIQKDLDYEKQLSSSRMSELEDLNNKYKESLKEIDKLKMDLQFLPENVIFETVEYKCLQSHFSVLYNESMQLKTQLEECRAMLQSSKTAHLRQIEHMESEELSMQKRLRTEVIQLEDQLAQVRKEYEMIRLEFQQTLAANEQTGPINKEMRHLITSLQNHNQQLKGEIQRYKRRLKESNAEAAKLKHQLDSKTSTPSTPNFASGIPASSNQSGVKVETKLEVATPKEATIEHQRIKSDSQSESGASIVKEEKEQEQEKKEGAEVENKPKSTSSAPPESPHQRNLHSVKKDSGEVESRAKVEKIEGYSGRSKAEIEVINLSKQLKKLTAEYKEMKLLLDMYKSAPKETREKVQLMAGEKKYRQESEELRKQLGKFNDSGRKKLTDEDTVKEVMKYKETICQLQKSLSLQKQEDEALLNEMEVTGNAFEDMQDLNLRLIQQLREKDDANFKLMSERIKSGQIQSLLKEEKESMQEQIIALQAQVEAQNQVVRKLEEKERLLQNNLSSIEKELTFRQQAMELHKRKAVEAANSAADLKLCCDKYLAQVKEAQNSVNDKTCALQDESYKSKRLVEETNSWKKKYERAKMFELATTADEVLMEETRELKAQLTCPSCKTRRKDAVLTKCFHVFCLDCLKTRYETRQRKCPKCNAIFGANDYHRLYLS